MNEISSKMKILVTYASAYDMPAEAGRDAMKGCIVQYFFFGENGEGLQMMEENNVDLPIGYQRNKVSMDYAMRAKIQIAPAIYDGTFKMVTGGDGKPVLKLVDVDFVRLFDFKLEPSKVAAVVEKATNK